MRASNREPVLAKSRRTKGRKKGMNQRKIGCQALGTKAENHTGRRGGRTALCIKLFTWEKELGKTDLGAANYRVDKGTGGPDETNSRTAPPSRVPQRQDASRDRKTSEFFQAAPRKKVQKEGGESGCSVRRTKGDKTVGAYPFQSSKNSVRP